ncbi:lysylphosphatidylglycerol synthase domain-containing protein [Patescibacteria group bacterium]
MQKEISAQKKWIMRLATLAFILVVFFFMGRTIFINWREISTYTFSLNILYLILSFAFIILSIVVQALIWRMILRTLQSNTKLSYSDGIGIFITTWLARYVPGTVLVFISRVVLTAQKGFNRRYTAVSMLLEAIFGIAGPSIVAVIFLLISGGAGEQYLIILLLAIVIGTILTHPRILYPAANSILYIAKRERIEKTHQFSLQRNLLFILLYVFVGVLAGIGFYFFISSIVPNVSFSLFHMIGVLNLASVLGLIAFFLPAGLGVREAVFILLLQLYIPLPIAVVVTIAARLWTVLADFLLIGTVTPFIKYRPYGDSSLD